MVVLASVAVGLAQGGQPAPTLDTATELAARSRALQHEVQALRTALVSGQLDARVDHAAVEKLSALQSKIEEETRVQRRMVTA